jgi:cytochrome c2
LWHYRHLWNPQLTSAGSIMPGYSYLFLASSTDAAPQPAPDAQALVAYLLALKANEAPKPGAVVAGLTLDTPLPAGNAASGQALFTAQACNACHSLKPGENIVGPSLAGLGKAVLARFTAPDYKSKASSAEAYLKESILNPSAYLVPTYPDAMLKDYPQKLNAQQLADLIAFLQTQ